MSAHAMDKKDPLTRSSRAGVRRTLSQTDTKYPTPKMMHTAAQNRVNDPPSRNESDGKHGARYEPMSPEHASIQDTNAPHDALPVGKPKGKGGDEVGGRVDPLTGPQFSSVSRMKSGRERPSTPSTRESKSPLSFESRVANECIVAQGRLRLQPSTRHMVEPRAFCLRNGSVLAPALSSFSIFEPDRTHSQRRATIATQLLHCCLKCLRVVFTGKFIAWISPLSWHKPWDTILHKGQRLRP